MIGAGTTSVPGDAERGGVYVLNAADGRIGHPLGPAEDCRCGRFPYTMQPGQAGTVVVELADPGGAALDVVFTSFHPVPAVEVFEDPSTRAPSGGPTYRVTPRKLTLPARTKVGAARTTGGRIELETDVLFAFDSATLAPKAQAALRTAAEKLKAEQGRKLAVYGHTDSKGAPAYNKTLSLKRAEAVRTALEPLLGGGWTFDVQGFGETKPIAAEKTEKGEPYPEGQALNRRVELRVLG